MIFLLIVTCDKHLKTRREGMIQCGYLPILESLRNKGLLNFFFIKGNPHLHPYVSHRRVNEFTLEVNCKDDYESLPTKIIKSFCVIKELFNPRLLIKTDDDCCLNLFRLFGSPSLNIEPIIDSLKSHHYCGTLGNYPESYKSEWNGASNRSKYIGPYMNGGMGYTLSPEALDFICNFPNLERILSLEIFEDKLIGDLLREKFDIYATDFWKWRVAPTKDMNYINLCKSFSDCISFMGEQNQLNE